MAKRGTLPPNLCADCKVEIRRRATRCEEHARAHALKMARDRMAMRAKQDPEMHARKRQQWAMRNHYGLTVDDARAKFEAQGGRCGVCAKPLRFEPGERSGINGRAFLDHDHSTGANRDFLCLSCNVGIGYFGDDPIRLRTAADYIERHQDLPAEVHLRSI